MTGELFPATEFEKTLIIRGEPILLYAGLAITVILLTLSSGLAYKVLRRKVSRKGAAAIFAIILIFIAFRAAFVPLTSRIFFDEDLYLNTGKNIAERMQACMCNYAEKGDCVDCIMNKAPSSHPFVLGWAVSLFGAERGQLIISTIFPALSIFLAFVSGTLLFGKESAGIVSAGALSAVPVFIEWSMTAAAEPTMLFFFLLSLATLMLFRETGSLRALFLFSTALSFLVQTKAEGILFFPIFYLGALLFYPWRRASLPANILHLSLSIALALALSSIALIHISIAGKGSDWGAGDLDKFSIDNFLQIFPVNSKFLLFGYPEVSVHPISLTIFSLVGLATMLVPKKGLFLPKQAIFLSVAFLSFFLLYCFFYAGSVKYGADVRYALSYYPALALLAGAFGRLLSRNGAIILAVFLIVSSFYYAFPQVSRQGPEIAEAKMARDYRDYALLEISRGNLPNECLIVSHVTSLYANEGYSTAQPWYIENPELSARIREGNPCIVFDYGFWCTVPPFEEGQCRRISETFSDRVVSRSPEGFVFYNVT